MNLNHLTSAPAPPVPRRDATRSPRSFLPSLCLPGTLAIPNRSLPRRYALFTTLPPRSTYFKTPETPSQPLQCPPVKPATDHLHLFHLPQTPSCPLSSTQLRPRLATQSCPPPNASAASSTTRPPHRPRPPRSAARPPPRARASAGSRHGASPQQPLPPRDRRLPVGAVVRAGEEEEEERGARRGDGTRTTRLSGVSVQFVFCYFWDELWFLSLFPNVKSGCAIVPFACVREAARVLGDRLLTLLSSFSLFTSPLRQTYRTRACQSYTSRRAEQRNASGRAQSRCARSASTRRARTCSSASCPSPEW